MLFWFRWFNSSETKPEPAKPISIDGFAVQKCFGCVGGLLAIRSESTSDNSKSLQKVLFPKFLLFMKEELIFQAFSSPKNCF